MSSWNPDLIPDWPDDSDAEAPACAWGCECPLCAPRYAAEANALARPEDLAVVALLAAA